MLAKQHEDVVILRPIPTIIISGRRRANRKLGADDFKNMTCVRIQNNQPLYNRPR